MNKNTIREVTDDFIGFLSDKTGRLSSSLYIPRRLIYDILRIIRNKVIYERVMSRLSMGDKLNIQHYFSCAELIPADFVECPCAPRSGMTWLKTKNEIPRFIDEKPSSVITVDSMTSFEYVKWSNFKEKINSRLPQISKGELYTLRTGKQGFRIYIYTNSDLTEERMLQGISFSGIPEDPLAASLFPACGEEEGQVCNILDREFFVPKEFEDRIYDLTMMKLNQYMQSQFGVDLINNEKDDRFTGEDRPEL